MRYSISSFCSQIKRSHFDEEAEQAWGSSAKMWISYTGRAAGLAMNSRDAVLHDMVYDFLVGRTAGGR